MCQKGIAGEGVSREPCPVRVLHPTHDQNGTLRWHSRSVRRKDGGSN